MPLEPDPGNDFALFINMCEEFLRERERPRISPKHSHASLMEAFTAFLAAPLAREMGKDVVLKKKVDAFGFAVVAIADHATEEDRKAFAGAMAIILQTKEGCRDPHLTRLHSLFVRFCGEWFIPLIMKSNQIEAA